jgi:hypothetical protein
VKFYSVVSSNVLAVGYNEKVQMLGVLFPVRGKEDESGMKSVSLYCYTEVPPQIWEGLKAPGVSIGSYLSEHVKKTKQYIHVKGFQFRDLADIAPEPLIPNPLAPAPSEAG